MSSAVPPRPLLRPWDTLEGQDLIRRLLVRVGDRLKRGERMPRCTLPAEKSAFPKVLFLDTNKWIELAQVHYGKSRSEAINAALVAIRRGVRSGQLVVPITVMNLSEVAKRVDEGSRRRLADFAVELSGNFSTLPNGELGDLEMDEALRKLYFETPITHAPRRSLVYWGTRTVYSTTIRFPHDPDPFVWRAAFEVQFEPEMSAMMMFEHGRDDGLWQDVRGIDERGRDSLAAIRAVDATLTRGEKLRRERRNQLKREGSKDHFRDRLDRRLRFHGIPVAGFLRWLESDDNILATFFDELPDFVVDSTLMFERDRNAQAPNHENDVVDLEFLRLAIPYGNFVVGEKLWAHYANVGGAKSLARRYGTTVLADLGKLPELLARELQDPPAPGG